ncbi:MAG: ZIP family metal transporter [Bacteroidota bacterium]
MLRIFLFGIIAASVEILGGILIVLRKEWPRKVQEYLIALSAGFILALVFFDLLPLSFDKLGPAASLYIVIGFSVLHFFEHTIVGHLHFGEETHTDLMVSPLASISALSGLIVHAFFDGATISAGLQFDFKVGLLVFLAVLLHKLPEGLTIASIMLAAKHTKRVAIISSVIIGVATILGVVVVIAMTNISQSMIGTALALSAGAATYVGASDLIPEINRSTNRITPVIVFGGMLLFYLSQIVVDSIVGV